MAWRATALKRSFPHLTDLMATGLSVVLLRASLPPFDFGFLSFFAWTPLLVVVQDKRPQAVVGWSLAHSFIFYVIALQWLMPALRISADASNGAAFAGLVMVSLIQAARTPLALLAVHWGKAAVRLPIWLTFPIVNAFLERFHPHLFPWSMALQVHQQPLWLQAASFGGVAMVSVWIGLLNALLAEAWVRRRTAVRDWGRFFLAALAVLGLASAAGYRAMEAQLAVERDAQEGHVALGHVRIPSHLREWDAVPTLRGQTISTLQGNTSVDLAIWPEGVVDRPTEAEQIPRLATNYLLRDRGRARDNVVSVPLLFGINVQQSAQLFNSAALVGPDGALLGRYDKRTLMPLGESSRVASWLPDLSAWLPAITPFASGVARDRLMISGHVVLPTICYEDILPSEFRNAVQSAAPELLVNLTSDAWFTGTLGTEFHFALAKLRSVEHRRYLVRATRNGVTSVVDSVGQVRYRYDGHSTIVQRTGFRWLSGTSLYTDHGDLWLWLLSAGIMLAALWRWRFGLDASTEDAPGPACLD